MNGQALAPALSIKLGEDQQFRWGNVLLFKTILHKLSGVNANDLAHASIQAVFENQNPCIMQIEKNADICAASLTFETFPHHSSHIRIKIEIHDSSNCHIYEI